MNVEKHNTVAAIKELITTHVSYMDEEALCSTLSLVCANLNAHTPIEATKHAEPFKVFIDANASANDSATAAAIAADNEGDSEGKCNPKSDAFINVMSLEGDVLRNSGLCAMGSMDMKQMMMEMVDAGAAAHIIVINSGGGNAYAVYDFKDMIDYAHANGQPVIAWVRGMAASAAYALAMMCDKVLCYSDHDIVGSIGCICAVMVKTENKENKYTFQTLRTVYAEKSDKKNYAYREAVKGNMQPFQEQADKLCEVFHNLCRECRPSIKEEQLNGEHFDSCEVVGSLVDETNCTFERAVEVAVDCISDYKIAALKAGTTVVR